MLQLPFLLCMVWLAQGAREADRVDNLPGLDPQPDFKHYAGYLSASPNKKFFYWFVESERNPQQDPLVLWLNGGPGCSSMTGFLVELGPWRVKPDGSGLTWFDQRWNKIANIIFMESPQCVGFSYAEDGNCTSGDNQTAFDNHEALKDFFLGFPEYKNNDFYVTGESYAGIYVPTLSARLVDDPEFNFKGFAVGNAVTDRRTMGNGIIYFAWARGLFGSALWEDLITNCCEDRNVSNCNYYDNEDLNCILARSEVNQRLWRDGLNPYNLYDDCYGGVNTRDYGIIRETDKLIEYVAPDELSLSKEEYERWLQAQRSFDKPAVMAIPCTDTSDRDTYLNNPLVREAIHVPNFVQNWTACSSNVSSVYDRQYTHVRNEYYKVLERGHRILVFNGDLDMACDHLSDMWFVEELEQEEEVGYKPWNYPHADGSTQIGGFVIQYRRLKYVTVKGAGHFVPTDKPDPAYLMWEKFLNDEPY